MKNIMKKMGIMMAMVSFGLAACAPPGDSDNKKAESAFNEAKNIEEKKCDGKGTGLSGFYKLYASEGSGKCDSSSETSDLEDEEMILKCTQKDDQFSCSRDKSDVYTLKGCVNSDESFTLTSPTDLGFMEKYIRTASGTKDEKVTIIEVDSSGSGTMNYSSASSKGDQKTSCNFKFTVQTELTEPAE